MSYIIVTNNPKCYHTYHLLHDLHFQDLWSYRQVLEQARDLLHRGLYLLTHPMAGSLKPNQTPYRSLVLAPETKEDVQAYDHVILIENALESYDKFLKNQKLPHWNPQIREDFQTIDLSHLQGALQEARTQFV